MKRKLIKEAAEEIAGFMPFYFKYINPIIHKDEKYSLNENQIKLIMMLYLTESQTPTKLSIFMDMPKGSLTTIIDSLVDKGFITKKEDINDRRKKNISITEKGKGFVAYKTNDSLLKFNDLFQNFKEDSLERIIIGFRELSRNLKLSN